MPPLMQAVGYRDIARPGPCRAMSSTLKTTRLAREDQRRALRRGTFIGCFHPPSIPFNGGPSSALEERLKFGVPPCICALSS